MLRDLPEKLEEIRYVRFEGEQKKLYDAQVLHMREMLAGQAEEDFNKNRFQVLAELTRLRQICCAPSLCFENYRGEAAKTDACVQLIQSAIDEDTGCLYSRSLRVCSKFWKMSWTKRGSSIM